MSSEYQVMNSCSQPLSGIDMNSNFIMIPTRETIQATKSLHREKTIDPPVPERVRRKPVASRLSGSRRSRPSIRTRLNSWEREMEEPLWRNSRPVAVDTPTAEPGVSDEMDIQEPHSQFGGIPHSNDIDNDPNSRVSGDWQQVENLYPNYNYSGDIGHGNIHDMNDFSSTTIDTQRVKIPPPLTLKPASSTTQPTPKSGLQDIALIATICAAHFLTQAGLAQSIAPIPNISQSFTTPTHTPSPSWYSAAYSLTVGTFILPSGRLGDIYGLKRLFIIGWLWFALSSLSAGFNPRILETIDQQSSSRGEAFFCVCRALQGIGPALLMPNGLGILGRRYEGKRKNMAFAFFGASAPVGFVVGAVMSSLLAEKIHWVWAYWAQAIVCLVMAVVSLMVIPSIPASSQENATTAEGSSEVESIWKRLDVPGAITGVTALILINIALNQATLVSWSTPYTYFILIIGLILLTLFLFLEFTPSLTPHPLIPPPLLTLDTSFILICIAFGWATFGIWIFYLWSYLSTLRTLPPLQTSLQFSPAAPSGLLAALTTGFLLSKTTPQILMLLSMCAFFTGTTLIATAPVNQTYWAQTLLSILVMPWGMDMSFPSATILLSGKVAPEHQGVAMSLVNTVVNYSISVGLGLAGTVERGVDGDGTGVLRGFRGAWYLGMGLSGVGIVVAVVFLVGTVGKGGGWWRSLRG